MADRYVDLERSGGGYSGTTELDPWSLSDFLTQLGLATADTYYTRGTGTVSDVIPVSPGVVKSILQWETGTPYRIVSTADVGFALPNNAGSSRLDVFGAILCTNNGKVVFEGNVGAGNGSQQMYVHQCFFKSSQGMRLENAAAGHIAPLASSLLIQLWNSSLSSPAGSMTYNCAAYNQLYFDVSDCGMQTGVASNGTVNANSACTVDVDNSRVTQSLANWQAVANITYHFIDSTANWSSPSWWPPSCTASDLSYFYSGEDGIGPDWAPPRSGDPWGEKMAEKYSRQRKVTDLLNPMNRVSKVRTGKSGLVTGDLNSWIYNGP